MCFHRNRLCPTGWKIWQSTSRRLKKMNISELFSKTYIINSFEILGFFSPTFFSNVLKSSCGRDHFLFPRQNTFFVIHLFRKNKHTQQTTDGVIIPSLPTLPPATTRSRTSLLPILVEYLGGVSRDTEVTLGQPLRDGRLENRREKQTSRIRESPGSIRCRKAAIQNLPFIILPPQEKTSFHFMTKQGHSCPGATPRQLQSV